MMNNYEKLTKENILLYAIQHYNNPSCAGMNEFTEDYNRIKYLKKLFELYRKEGIIKERLFLNHIIIFFNVFGIEAATRILFAKIDDKYWSIVKTCLIYLSLYNETIPHMEINLSEIPLDPVIQAHLEENA